MSKKLVVNQDEENPIAPEVMAQAIVDIGQAMKRISRSRLSRKALVILVAHSAKEPQYIIEKVLDSLDSLEKDYLNPKPKI